MVFKPELKIKITEAIQKKDSLSFAECMNEFQSKGSGFFLEAITIIPDGEEGDIYMADFTRLVKEGEEGAPDVTPDRYHIIWSFWLKGDVLRAGIVCMNWENQLNNYRLLEPYFDADPDDPR